MLKRIIFLRFKVSLGAELGIKPGFASAKILIFNLPIHKTIALTEIW